VCFGLTGFLMNALFTLAERRLLPWLHDDAEATP